VRAHTVCGAFAPIPTAFDETGTLALGRLVENLAKWNETSLAGYVVLGSNGESVHIEQGERASIIAAARKAIPSDKLLIVGTGAHSTSVATQRTQEAAELGADATLVLTPHYYKGQMTADALRRHYLALANASTIPLLLYQVPRFTGLELEVNTIIELAQHPNIVGIKDSTGNLGRLGETIRRAASGFSVLAGSGSFFYPALTLGAEGGVLAVANVLPDECCQIYRAVQEGRYPEGRELQLRIIAVNDAITTRFGVPGLKAALDLLGYYGGPPRAPLAYPSRQQVAEIREVLHEAISSRAAC
jgi:4-hydroxy-2-oxoglutarate aldolase